MAKDDKKKAPYVISVHDLKKLHNVLAASLRDHLDLKDHGSGLWVHIDQYDTDGEWEDYRSPVQFAALLERPSYAYRNNGGRVPVIPLDLERTHCQQWACWHEKWLRLSRGTFELITASWTFFKGFDQVNDKLQFLRCDWDNPEYLNEKRARPHWHFEFCDGYEHNEVVEDSKEFEELEEINATGESGIGTMVSLTKYHFGMAGCNISTSYPASWQANFVARDLSKWSIMVLKHVRHELGL